MEKLRGFNVDNYLSFLNPLLKTNFELTAVADVMNEEETRAARKSVFNILLTQSLQEFWVILIDDVEFLNQESFELFECIFNSNATFTVMTQGHQRKLSPEQNSILRSSQVLRCHLAPIDLMHQTELACQCLNVSALSSELEQYIFNKSFGNPGWIETFTKFLIQSQKLEIVQEGDPKYLVATIKDNLSHHEYLTNSIIDNDLMTYDSLTTYEQLVCKCASVLGLDFDRKMLFYVIANSSDRMIGIAMVKLFELHIFTCASACDQENLSKEKRTSDGLTCCCQNLKIFESCDDLHKVASCAKLKFQRETFRRVVYGSLTEKQRLDYHRRSLVYLHLEAKQCDVCGNHQFQQLQFDDLDFKFNDGVVDSDYDAYEAMINYFDSINYSIRKPEKRSMLSSLFRQKEVPKVYPIVLNYLNYNFSNCSCSSILYTLYSKMIDHCHGGDMLLKLIDSKIELANICISRSNIPRAIKLLRRAMFQLEVRKRL